MILMSESHCWHLFYKKLRGETVQLFLEFDNFKLQLEIDIFQCISWLNGSFFKGDDRLFWKSAESRRHQCRLLTHQLFSIFTSIVYVCTPKNADQQLLLVMHYRNFFMFVIIYILLYIYYLSHSFRCACPKKSGQEEKVVGCFLFAYIDEGRTIVSSVSFRHPAPDFKGPYKQSIEDDEWRPFANSVHCPNCRNSYCQKHEQFLPSMQGGDLIDLIRLKWSYTHAQEP
jgi:hypothetical protein